MDDPQVLVNILMDLKTNVDAVLRMCQTPSEEAIEDRFYQWIQHPVPLETLGPPPIFSEEATLICRFADVVAKKISQHESVDDGQAQLAKLEVDLEKAETRLRQLQMTSKDLEANWRIEKQSRLELIRDLQLRIEQTEIRTAAALRLAKECGETARTEWEEINRKPLEERQLRCRMLQERLNTLKKDNAITEAQLMKCRAERAMELEALRVKVEADLRGRQAELDKLKDEVAVESLQMQELEEELRVVTAEYDVIMAKKREEELEIIRRRMDERNRERAAIKIQRWFRFYLFRTMRARRRRKKAKRKVSKEIMKKDATGDSKPAEVSNANAIIPLIRPDSPLADDEVDEPPVSVPTVLVSRKPAPPASKKPPVKTANSEAKEKSGKKPPPAAQATPSEDPLKKRGKKSGNAIRSVTVKKTNDAEPNPSSQDSQASSPPMVVNVNRSSQTDNRVPKSKQVYR